MIEINRFRLPKRVMGGGSLPWKGSIIVVYVRAPYTSNKTLNKSLHEVWHLITITWMHANISSHTQIMKLNYKG